MPSQSLRIRFRFAATFRDRRICAATCGTQAMTAVATIATTAA